MSITSYDIRRLILEQSWRAGVGHIGSALSIADIVATLYNDILRAESPDDFDRDRFILSKGHAALALYASLFLKGWITKEKIDSYCAEGSQLGVHPEHCVDGIDFSSGSLGHGLSFAAGEALGAALSKSNRRIYVLLSDGECNEGSVWEAALFAAHHQLTNLIAIIDCNGQQAMGYTEKVLSLEPLADRWRTLNWDVHEVNGHDPRALQHVLAQGNETGRPRVIIAHTVSGKGVSFMENSIKWHYWPMSEDEYVRACADIQYTQ